MVNLAVLDSSHLLKTKSKMSLSLLTKEPGGKSKELFMMSKIKDAEKKIHDEMNNADGCVKVVGKYLLDLVSQSEENAEAVLNKKCSIKKSLDVMKTEVKKKAKNGMAVLTDEEGFKIIRKYYGIGKPDEENPKIIKLDTGKIIPDVVLDIDLDSLLD